MEQTVNKKIEILAEQIAKADTIIIGAGAGLSASAGLLYSGERFTSNFPDFIAKYKLPDMYSAAFHTYKNPQEHWAYWSRHIQLNRYTPLDSDVYSNLLALVSSKDYFAITTNVDHLFQRSGFDKQRLFYTQGDYGLWQCSKPCHYRTYDNHDAITKMIVAQQDMSIPRELVPHCPECGAPMDMNLRKDSTFVQDSGWDSASARYQAFIDEHQDSNLLFIELGVGYNTPSIIKYPFWQMTYNLPSANMVSINLNDSELPKELGTKAFSIGGDIGEIIRGAKNLLQ